MEYFITGIDTEIGKTFVTKGLALAAEKQGLKAGVFKPVQSGAVKQGNQLLAPDIESVKALSPNIKTCCSYILEGEVSPALAARLSNISINIDKIKDDFIKFSNKNDITFVEGAGGLLAPVSDNLLCADLIKILNIPVIIVTVPFLGRLNHTLLTVHYAKTNGIKIKGIIINKFNEKTKDTASLNFINELKMYTDINILGIIKDLKQPDINSILAEFNNINLIS